MKEPTKADLATAVARLTEENAGLRDLLAAVSECARSVPLAAAGEPSHKERFRASDVLIRIQVVTDPGSTWVWSWGSGQGAAHLRELAAEPVGYEVYAKPALCRYCAIEPATEGGYCEACAPAVQLATGALDAAESDEAAAVPS